MAIDDSTYERLQSEMRRRGCSLREIVNLSLRQGLDTMAKPRARKAVKLRTFSAAIAPGASLDCIPALLERLDGPGWR